ncbi:hypothetical protein J6TS2_51140 [Heyndrickxia sporothermodurans]|nr:hypothetical protein J6TS2_51140 [Heyndrickxia sporothermodurans]
MKQFVDFYQFKGLYNFRDIGGFKTSNGKTMRKGVLFRSGELSRLTNQDINKMNSLGLKLICDLRTPQEIKSKPSRMEDQGVRIKNISIYDKSQEFTHFEFFNFFYKKSNSIDFRELMMEMYQNMAFSSFNEIRSIFHLLSNEENLPALIHCTGGKDRTGFIAAIIQLLVGVQHEIVIEKYLYSNQLIEPRMKKVEKFIQIMSLFQVSSERIKPILEVRREYLNDVLSQIIKRYGSIEVYLSESCNISSDCLKNLKEHLLES